MSRVGFSLCMLLLVALPSCRSVFSPSLMPDDERKIEALRAQIDAIPNVPSVSSYQEGTYEYFVSHRFYLDTLVVYRDSQLLSKATPECPIYICLQQQRGRLYVDGRVALDWPVSTGTDKTPTSRGSFVILEKKKEHFSGRFGTIRGADGSILVAEADSRKHTVPPGGKWEGASMPNWMRLTDSGIGMHTGLVMPGKQLSHGCIRMPHEVSSIIFDIVKLGSPVYVREQVEDVFPCKAALREGDVNRSGDEARKILQEKLDTLTLEAEKRAVVYAETLSREADARERAEEEAEARAKAERKAAREAERAERARRKAEERAAEEARERAEEEAEARAKAERKAAREAERAERARRKAEERAAEEARERAEEEAEARAKAERKAAREAERAERARRKAEERAAEEARERAEGEAEARAKAERRAAREAERAAEEARERAEEEAEARAKAERRAAREAERAAEEARERAEGEAEARAKAERRAAREAERAERARRKAEERAAEEARERAEEEAEARAKA
ncbi:MAG: L,D-transpeptidase, partial [Akkermansia sp.]|nr:L,D-transpeptidase [Akkermansia sp.]